MNKKNLILAIILLLLCFASARVYFGHLEAPVTGEKTISITVIHSDQTKNSFTYDTDAEYLAEVLLENKLANGEQSSYGLFIQTVDGETADDSKQQWWCITKGGEQVNSGADALPIADGDQFELTLMEGY